NRLYATEDNADRLAVVDLRAGQLVGEPRLGLPSGMTTPLPGKGINPNGMTLLRDHRLLVTLGGINALAVVAPGGAAVQGLVPTGWYPSAVATDAKGARVFVINRKS
ncbi:YncE family protein, partial [Mycobacterium tuberculosis]